MKKSNVRVIELAQYTIPEAKEYRQKEWVEYGDDNNFYQELIDARQSATHNAMINGITEALYGRGLAATDASRKPEDWAQAITLFKEDTLRCLFEDFYAFGDGYLQVIWNQGHTKIVEVHHTPTINWRPSKFDSEKDEILQYFYLDDWANKKPTDKPQAYPAFGTSKEGVEILRIMPYRSGYYYFAPPEYISALPYAQIEVEVANYHLNNILNGFSSNTIINLNNGVPDDEERDQIEQQIISKFTGSENAGRVVIAFNESQERAATLETVQLNDAHNQYEFIAKEAERKILASHRITSPILVGLKTEGSSLGSNADELRMASQLFENTVIKPQQRIVIEALQKILAANGIALDLYVKTAQPIEFTEVETAQIEDANIERETGVEGVDSTLPTTEDKKAEEQKDTSYNGAQIASAIDIMSAVSEGVLTREQAIAFLIQMLRFDPDTAKALFSARGEDVIRTLSSQVELDALLEELGEDEPGEWELIDESDSEEGDDDEIRRMVEEANSAYVAAKELSSQTLLSKIVNLVSTGTARPNAKSDRDEKTEEAQFKVRYEYSPRRTSAESREFCKKMVSAAKLYRREDIEQMSSKPVNPGWGPNGANTYDIFKYKGGGDCHHRWVRKVYMRKDADGNIDVKSPRANRLVTSIRNAKGEGYSKGVDPDYDLAKKRPTDMPNNGFLKPRG